MKNSIKSIFYVLFSTLLILHALLPLTARLLPFIDMPMHLASSTIIKNIGDPCNAFSNWFYLKGMSLQTNAVFQCFVNLPVFHSVETGARVFTAIYLVLLPISLLLTIRKFGGDPVYALFGFLVLYNTSVLWGFTNCYMAIPLIMFFIMALYDYLYKGKWYHTLILVLVSIVLFYTHGLITIYALGLFGTALLWRYYRNIKLLLIKALAILPVLLLISHWFLAQVSEDTGKMGSISLRNIAGYYRHDYLLSIFTRLGLIYRENYLYNFNFWGQLFASSFLIFLIVVIVLNIKKTNSGFSGFMQGNSNDFALLLLLTSAVIMLIVPAPRNGLRFTFVRLGVYLFLFFILYGSLHIKKPFNKTMIAVIGLVCLIHWGTWLDYFQKFNHENREFTADLFPDPEPDRILTGLIFEAGFHGHPLYVHFPDYYIVWKHGIATPSFTKLGVIWRIGSIPKLPEYTEWLYLNIHRQEEIFDKYENVDYILVRKKMTLAARRYFKDYTLYKQQGDWQVWARQETNSPAVQ